MREQPVDLKRCPGKSESQKAGIWIAYLYSFKACRIIAFLRFENEEGRTAYRFVRVTFDVRFLVLSGNLLVEYAFF